MHAFISVLQKVISEKEAIFNICREVLDDVLLHMLEEQEGRITFDSYTFVSLIARVNAGVDKMLEFIF